MKLKNLLKACVDWIVLLLKGIAVGAGAILPGISGGVLCAAFGIYEPMMALLSHPFKSFKKYYRMFIPFVIGWLAGFLLLAGAVTMLFEAASGAAMALFAGLIFGTLPAMIKKSEQSDPKQSWAAMVISMAVLFALLSFLENGAMASVKPNIPWYAFCGAVWGLSLVIPGLSSSSVLIYMGLYQPMTEGIAALDFSVILPLFAGIAFTVLLSARAVNHLFNTSYALMSRIVVGVIIPPTLMIIPTSFDSVLGAFIAAVCFAAGFAAAMLMDRAQDKRSAAAITDSESGS